VTGRWRPSRSRTMARDGSLRWSRSGSKCVRRDRKHEVRRDAGSEFAIPLRWCCCDGVRLAVASVLSRSASRPMRAATRVPPSMTGARAARVRDQRPKKLFAAGDMRRGQSLVVWAIAKASVRARGREFLWAAANSQIARICNEEGPVKNPGQGVVRQIGPAVV